jgi:lysyl-tRNA synthetase class 2
MADLGDFISARGRVISSKTGELSVLAETWAIVSKALRPLPVLHKELSNEASSRRRYLDFITDPESAELMKIRSQVINSLRENYFRRGYIELETPIIQTIHGGAAAKPFQTRIHAFDLDVFLRISPELFLKRAVVGGLERVFEINRVFRNEGVDSTHSPEFTMLESYQAYADYNDVAQLTQNLIQRCAEDVFGTTELKLRDGEIFDLGGTWQTRDFYATLSEAIGEEITPQTPFDALRKIAPREGLEKDVLSHDQPGLVSHGKLAELLFEHFWLEKFQQPTFIRDFPLDTSPLVSSSPDNPAVVEKWDLYIRGMELATGYSELTDPVVQRERLIQQSKLAAAGDEEAMSIDEEFLEALEHGMPPTGGLGLGIDRLLMALTGVTSIRETIPFPLVKPIGRV